MMTKNFRLNALANQFAAAVYDSVRQQSGGDWFPMTIGRARIEVAITDGVKGIRELVDSFALAPLKEDYPQWESMGIVLMTKCVTKHGLTEFGREFWGNMLADMAESLDAGGFNEN